MKLSPLILLNPLETSFGSQTEKFHENCGLRCVRRPTLRRVAVPRRGVRERHADPAVLRGRRGRRAVASPRDPRRVRGSRSGPERGRTWERCSDAPPVMASGFDPAPASPGNGRSEPANQHPLGRESESAHAWALEFTCSRLSF